MAARTTRNTGLIFTLIFFVFLSIVGIALGIVFYTQLDKERVAAAGARDEINKYIESGRRSAPEVQQLLADAKKEDPNRTLVTHLLMTLDRLKRIITGSEQVSVAAVA